MPMKVSSDSKWTSEKLGGTLNRGGKIRSFVKMIGGVLKKPDSDIKGETRFPLYITSSNTMDLFVGGIHRPPTHDSVNAVYKRYSR